MDNIVHVDFRKKKLTPAAAFLKDLEGELMQEDIDEIVASADDYVVYTEMDVDLKLIAEEYFRLSKIV